MISKDPAKVAAGAKGARAHWGPQRILRLDKLPEPVAAAVLAMVEAERHAREKAADDAA